VNPGDAKEDGLIDADSLSEVLESFADAGLARRRGKHLKPLKGLRGTPLSEVARVSAVVWKEGGVSLFDDADELHNLFCTAQEDGLLAIGLVAAAAPDDPDEALDLAERWLEMVDDLETADALGWSLYGPALLASDRSFEHALLSQLGSAAARRRVAVMALMAALPVPMEGPSVAALRERVGERHIVITGEPLSAAVSAVCHGYRADSDPHVRKALGRVLRTWGECDPEAAAAWLVEAQDRGGMPKFMRESALKGVKKGRRRLQTLGDSDGGAS